jgi:hypothetical protein
MLRGKIIAQMFDLDDPDRSVVRVVVLGAQASATQRLSSGRKMAA